MVLVAELTGPGKIGMFEFEAGVDHQHLIVDDSESTVLGDVRIYFHHMPDSMLQVLQPSMVLKGRVVS